MADHLSHVARHAHRTKTHADLSITSDSIGCRDHNTDRQLDVRHIDKSKPYNVISRRQVTGHTNSHAHISNLNLGRQWAWSFDCNIYREEARHAPHGRSTIRYKSHRTSRLELVVVLVVSGNLGLETLCGTRQATPRREKRSARYSTSPETRCSLLVRIAIVKACSFESFSIGVPFMSDQWSNTDWGKACPPVA